MTERPSRSRLKNKKTAEMNIHSLFSEAAFDPEATEAMGLAFEAVCNLKPKVSRELIANRIIQLAKAVTRINCARKS